MSGIGERGMRTMCSRVNDAFCDAVFCVFVVFGQVFEVGVVDVTVAHHTPGETSPLTHHKYAIELRDSRKH